jgi:uncharacterized protein YfaS (alpha-2-macroglobulin family)
VSIGGDGELTGKKQPARANRFKPMVRVIGPFKLNSKQQKIHKISIPNYFGSAKIMVIAGNDAGAWGNAEKKVIIQKPLMILTTLPRVVSPGETVKLPVSIFALTNSIKEVTLSCSSNAFFKIDGPSTQRVSIKKTPDERMATFDLVVSANPGFGKVKVTATCGKESASSEIELEVRSPNLEITDVTEAIVQPGKSWNAAVIVSGMAGTRSAVLELSSMPAINLNARLNYLTGYPHGCAEQTVSAVFPQLYLSQLMELDESTRTKTNLSIRNGLKRLLLFQTSSGGIAFWPGGNEVSTWVTNYAGHFIIEAQGAGYSVSTSFLNRWKRFQRESARQWKLTNPSIPGEDLIQAYRLYTLALSGSPEMGAMNRLREAPNLSNQAKWRLAAAYKLAGQTETALGLIRRNPIEIPDYTDSYFTLGSDERDEAMILETLVLMDLKREGFPIAKSIAGKLGKSDWMSTQTTAYCLLAMAKFNGTTVASANRILCDWSESGKINHVKSAKPLVQIPLTLSAAGIGKLNLKNTHSTPLFVRIIKSGTPGTDQPIPAAQNGLKLNVAFTDLAGKMINPKRIIQGTDFNVRVTITNMGNRGYLANLVLEMLFASGWELNNSRVADFNEPEKYSLFDFQDIRDDRVNTYLGLKARETKTFSFKFNAAYLGKFYLPSFSCKSMYENTLFARNSGYWVEVVRAEGPDS